VWILPGENMEQVSAHDFLSQPNDGPAVMKLSVCTLSNRAINYWLRSWETDETNPLGDVLE
jgi:hypothetical protein